MHPDSQTYEISPRFCQTLQERIFRLLRDAARDELALPTLTNEDHIRRHSRLIAVQRQEAGRIGNFLEISRARLSQPLIEI
jgi:hypothetical protein